MCRSAFSFFCCYIDTRLWATIITIKYFTYFRLLFSLAFLKQMNTGGLSSFHPLLGLLKNICFGYKYINLFVYLFQLFF